MPDIRKPESGIPALARQNLPARKPDPAAVAILLDQWMRGDEAEQRKTFEFLRRTLDEDRPEGFKLFP
jgi:hypothetical protein